MDGPVKQPRSGVAVIMLALLLPGFVTPAAAQRPTQEQQNAIRQSCRADYQAVCASVPTGGTAALACLQQNTAQLSAPCRSAVAAVGSPGNTPGTQAAPPAASRAPQMAPREEMATLRESCGMDYRRFCRGVRPGGGRAIGCLKDNAESLSSGCRNALSAAAH